MLKTASRCLFALALAMAAAVTVAHAQTYTVLYNFGTKNGDPEFPTYEGILAQGRDGNVYSTAPNGGANNNFGAVFKVTPSGKLTAPYNFDSAHGYSISGLTLGTDGKFYGTTYDGGTSDLGTVFSVSQSGSLSVLYNFSGSDGSNPYAPPIQGSDGNFYGTTFTGGANDWGSVYKITPSGSLKTLYSFNFTDGYRPGAPLVQGTDGNFYGTTVQGGANSSYGVVYKITTSGKLTVIYNFDGTHGGQTYGPLIVGSDGNLYGTSFFGKKGEGVVFKITPSGKLTVLHNMNGTTDGANPFAGLVQATDGNFYGVCEDAGSAGLGTIFRLTPQGIYTVLYNFDGTTGWKPDVTLLQDTNGILYGDTSAGGTVGEGVFFSLNLGLSPFASLVNSSAKVGKTAEILGQGFTGTTGVSFDGTGATFTVVSNTYLTATVPNGATTGPVTVTTPGGVLTSNKIFRVTPVILSFNPQSGPVGTPVTITGTSFTGATQVTFGGVKATSFSVDSDTQITATVPTGAKTGKIAVTTPGGTAKSATNFTVTP